MRKKAERMDSQKVVAPRTCPFCGARLVAVKMADMVHGGEVIAHYYHPMSDCILSYYKIYAKEVEKWNRREGK